MGSKDTKYKIQALNTRNILLQTALFHYTKVTFCLACDTFSGFAGDTSCCSCAGGMTFHVSPIIHVALSAEVVLVSFPAAVVQVAFSVAVIQISLFLSQLSKQVHIFRKN